MLRVLRTLALLLAPVCAAHAQQGPPPSTEVPQVVDSGVVSNDTDQPAVIVSFPAQVPGAEWVRLTFSAIELPEGRAALRITSVQDGAQQVLDARACREWRRTSAYFNGDDVQVEVVADAHSGPCRVVLASLTAGLPPFPNFTQCGGTDDRVLSFDPRACRTLPGGCTAWIIDDCRHNLLTAGHCGGASLQVLEFNVPPSTSTGTQVHSAPEDQYAVDAFSQQYVNGGVGNDFAYFGCFANPNTGLRPFQKQQAAYTLAAAAPAYSPTIVLRSTGYGADTTPLTANQVQQTATGPYTGHIGTVVDHQVDTENGSSGAPIVWEQTGLAIGIHTHGGCTVGSGSNHGTAIENPTLQAALANPIGSCVCVGEARTFCTGKLNSQGCVELIGFAGTPSASGGPGSFFIGAGQIVNNKTGLFFYGFGPNDAPFQGATLCATAPLTRTPAQNSGGNSGPDDCSGTYSLDMGARIASGVDPALVVGATCYGQYWSRDPGSAPFFTGLTNAVQFSIGP